MRRLGSIFIALSFVLLLTGHTKWGRDGSWSRVDREWGRVEEAVWTPIDLPNIVDWWRVGRGVTKDASDKVSAWEGSINGISLSQANGANQPTWTADQLNGYPAIVFDGDGDHLAGAFGADYSQPNTVIIVCSEPTDNDAVRWMTCGSQSGKEHSIQQSGGGNKYTIYAGATLVSTQVIDSGFKIWSAVFNGGSSLLRVNGTQKAGGNVSTRTLNGLSLGTRYPTPVLWADISVTDVIVCSTGLTTAEMEKVERWLNVKRGGIY